MPNLFKLNQTVETTVGIIILTGEGVGDGDAAVALIILRNLVVAALLSQDQRLLIHNKLNLRAQTLPLNSRALMHLHLKLIIKKNTELIGCHLSSIPINQRSLL